MSEYKQRRPAPGMVAVGAAFGCALVAGLVIRDYSESELVRLAVPIAAALIGIVVVFQWSAWRNRDRP